MGALLASSPRASSPRMRGPSVLLAFAVALLAGPAQAGNDSLDRVRAALAQFAGTTPVQATLERAVTAERKDRPLEAGRATLRITAGPAGITLLYPAALLEQIRLERAQTDPEKAKPTTRTLDTFDAIDVAALLNGPTALLTDLEGATVKSEAETTYKGQPARLLELELKVRTSKANSKWLKSASSSMRLWVDAGFVPLAAESEFNFRAGFLMFTFDGKDLETHDYSRVGDRLLAQRYTTRFDGDGLGESQHMWSETTLKILPASPPGT
jgi:hypothetical protein